MSNEQIRIYDLDGILYRQYCEKGLDGVFSLIKSVGSSHKDVFYFVDDKEYYRTLFEENLCIVALDRGKVIASCCCLIGSNMTKDVIDAIGESDIESSMLLKSYQVQEDYRGKGIGKNIIKVLLREIGISGYKIKNVYAIVHPDNVPSQRVLKACGFEKIAYSEDLYVGGPRDILKLSIDEV